VLTNVLLLEVSHAARFNVTIDHEFTDFVATSTLDDLTGASSELEPRHRMLLPILFIMSLPHGVASVHVGSGGRGRGLVVNLNLHWLRVVSGRMILFC
jgi:hypothetical protein